MPKVLHSQGTWKLAKCSVCVQNGYDGDSEIVSELARHTALKRWIATEILWYRNAASRVSAVQRVALLPISVGKCWASFARRPSVSIATGQKIWLDKRLLYLADFLSDAAVAALAACAALTIIIIIIIIIIMFTVCLRYQQKHCIKHNDDWRLRRQKWLQRSSVNNAKTYLRRNRLRSSCNSLVQSSSIHVC